MPPKSAVYARWALEMRRSRLLRPGDRVGVAVSGGPDSVLLLEFMRQFATKAGLRLAVVHFNHRLRGAESDADERFVAERAEELGLDFFDGRADVGRIAREKRRNVEATARELRYRFFLSLVRQGRVDKVATAHTANDQAETVLLRLVRGTGVRGLGGIYPALDGGIVRPFLILTRAEIERELTGRGLEYRVDSSNSNPALARTRVRTELIPLLERSFNPRVVVGLKQLADRARDEENFLEQAAAERARAWRIRESACEKIPIRPLTEFPPAITRRVLRQMIASARGGLQRMTHEHLEEIEGLLREGQSGREVVLPGGCVASREFDWLRIGPAAARGLGFSYPVALPGRVRVPEAGLIFYFELTEIVGGPPVGQGYNGGAVLLDPDRLAPGLVLRSWRVGDRFRPSGSRRPLKVKELFQRHRIALAKRSLWPMLESGGELVWVRDCGTSRNVLLGPGSRRMLKITEEPISP